MWISPAVCSSRPAMIRSSVDLPEPEGPTSARNSPSLTSMLTDWSAAVAPNDLLTLRMEMFAMHMAPWYIPSSRAVEAARSLHFGPCACEGGSDARMLRAPIARMLNIQDLTV